MQQEGVHELFPERAFEAERKPARRSIEMVGVLRRQLTLPRLTLGLISALSLFFGLFNIGNNGYANEYYAAAVRSMLENWHAFFFASLDSQGFVSVDKPPTGLWIQTASAWLFGFHGWSILLPQALASVGSVLLVFNLVRKPYGEMAGLIAAFALAIAPVNVAVARNNTSDGLLVFVLLLGATCLMRAARTGHIGWLMGAMAFVGIGFNIKMMEAYLVLPAFVAVYVVSSTKPFWRRIGQLLLAGVVLLAVSFSWATVVALTPPADRPYVGSTQDNSIFSLIFGYNGINRLLPRGWSIFGITNSTTSSIIGGGSFRGGGVGGASENGPQGVFRLLDTQLAGQVGWLIPLAVVGLVAAWGRPRFRKLTDQQLLVVLFGGWAAVEIVFFSLAGFYHRYYLSTLSPAIAVLAGIGLVVLWKLFRAGGWRAAFLPAAVVLAAASQYRILGDYPVWKNRLGPVLIAGAGVSVAVFLVYILLSRKQRFNSGRFGAACRLLAMAGVLTLFAAPFAWSYTTTTLAGNGSMPSGGPAVTSGGRGGFNFGSGGTDAARFAQAAGTGSGVSANTALIAYLEANKGSAAYLLAVTSSQQADQIIISTGEAVMSMGGFSGSDPILTVDSLKKMIAAGEVRFFMTSSRGGFGGGFGATGTGRATTVDRPASTNDAELGGAVREGESRSNVTANAIGGSTSLTSWITQNCKVVSDADIAAASPSITSTESTLGSGLYDCKGAATAS